jgi:hypothetical protein
MSANPAKAVSNEPESEVLDPWEQPHWSFLKLASFRFLFCYLMLFGTFCIQFMLGLPLYLLTGKYLSSPLDPLWSVLGPWVARYILHLSREVPYVVIDSGDSPSDYVVMFSWIVLAIVAAGVWSVLDRRRANYVRLNQFLRLVVQVLLAGILFSYGFGKVFPTQFGSLTPSRMMGNVGDLSPMDMLWLFMAASKPYTIFGGLLEVSAGVLLLVPKLRFLGAMLAIVVMGNILALNLAYDVSVKGLSLHYLLMAIYLAAPEFPSLVTLLIVKRAVRPKPDVDLSSSGTVTRWAWRTQAAFGLFCFLISFAAGAKDYSTDVSTEGLSPLTGVWKVTEFTISGDPHRSVLTDKLASKLHVAPGEDRWANLIVERSGNLVIRFANGELEPVKFKLKSDKIHGELSDESDKNWKGQLSLQRQGTKLLNLHGEVNRVEVNAKLRLEVPAFQLDSGAFHIVQDQ